MKFSWMILATACVFSSVQAQSAPPDCSLDCLMTIVPQVCGSLTNLTCLCTSTVVAAELTPCVSSACNITDSLRVLKYQADTCGVKEDRSRINQQLQLYYVMPALTFIVVVARIASRIVLDVGVKEDDYMMVAAEAFYLTGVGTGLVMVLNEFGEHTYSLTIPQITISLKFFYICELFYILTITFTKLSLLLFFRRIFPNQQFNRIVWATFGFVLATNFSLFMALTFQCTPIHGNWTNWMYKVAPVKCIDVYAAVFSAAGCSIIHDIVILLLPLPLLWNLHLPWQKKANLLVMFTLGSFVVICSALRLPSLLKLQRSADPSYDQAPIAVWTNLEQSVGIICGCLPACRSLLGWLFPGLKMSLQVSSKQSSAYGLGYSKHSKTTSRPDRLDRDFIELDDNASSEEHAGQGGRAGSVHSKESQVPFGEDLVPNKGKHMGHRTYVNVRETSLEKKRAPTREKSNHSMSGSQSGIVLTRSVMMTEQRSGPQR